MNAGRHPAGNRRLCTGRGAWLALALSACGAGGARPPNALLITLDTTRADALGAYGAPAGTTPALDALAAQGITFTAARSVAPLTLPAHASILTGLYPPRHRVRDNELWSLAEEARTLAEAARAAGFETAGFAAAAVLDRAFGLAQGFDTWEQPQRSAAPELAGGAEQGAELPAEVVAARASAWLERRDRSRPFLCWMHLYDAHLPLTAPERFLRRTGGNAYLAEVARADGAVGALLALLSAQGELERTVVLVAGDHGEANGEHGEGTHGHFVYDSTLRVPLILRLPGGERAGTRDDRLASLVDIYPTLAGLLGLGEAPELDGRDLLAPPAADPGAYFESYHGYLHFGWSPLAGWIDARGKYVHSSSPELFDPARDPTEAQDRIGSATEEELGRYRARIAEVAARPGLAVDRAAPDEELARRIRELGYTEGAAAEELPGPLDASDLPSPHRRAEELARVTRALELARGGARAEAARLLRGVLADNPANHTARAGLAYALLESREHAAAAAEFEALIAAAPRSAAHHAALGSCLEELDRGEEALEHYLAAVELDPDDGATLRRVAALLQRLGRAEEAEAWRERVRALASGAEDGVSEGN